MAEVTTGGGQQARNAPAAGGEAPPPRLEGAAVRSPRLPEGAESLTFEQLMTALETITSRLAVGELDIEEAADLYEQAEALHALAARRLAQVQERVDALRPPRT